jgi:hypothetical protein
MVVVGKTDKRTSGRGSKGSGLLAHGVPRMHVRGSTAMFAGMMPILRRA